MKFFVALISFVASASAYSISSPGGSAGWTTAGPNSVTWTRVSTDPSNFTVVLSNQVRSLLLVHSCRCFYLITPHRLKLPATNKSSMHSLTAPLATSLSARPARDSPPAAASRSTSFRTRTTLAPSWPSRSNSQSRKRPPHQLALVLLLLLCMSFSFLSVSIT